PAGGSLSASSCSLSPVSTGVASCSVFFTPALAKEGTQHSSAKYEGDTDHAVSTSAGFALTVTTRSTSTVVSCSPNPVAVNASTTCTATVTDTGAGTVTTPTGTVDSWATDVPAGGSFSASSCSLSPVST